MQECPAANKSRSATLLSTPPLRSTPTLSFSPSSQHSKNLLSIVGKENFSNDDDDEDGDDNNDGNASVDDEVNDGDNADVGDGSINDGGDGVGVIGVCYPTRNEGSGRGVWPSHSYRPMR